VACISEKKVARLARGADRRGLGQLGAWSRPPKEMLPPGTKFRFQKESVHTNFVLNDAGEAQARARPP